MPISASRLKWKSFGTINAGVPTEASIGGGRSVRRLQMEVERAQLLHILELLEAAVFVERYP
jgi:hypothetical protein